MGDAAILKTPEFINQLLKIQDANGLHRQFPTTFRAQSANARTLICLQSGTHARLAYDLGKLKFTGHGDSLIKSALGNLV